MKDTNPLTTPNTILTDCLNGTTITYNGKEFVLQNDMGNAVVDTASLKRGYIPVGLKEYNGIIYVASYNPLENRVEFGSFPSPERDFTGEELNTFGQLGLDGVELEGCLLKTGNFYAPNTLHPAFANGGSDIDPEVNPTDQPLIIVEESLTPSNFSTSTATTYSSTKVPVQGLDISDYWEMNTINGQPKFNIVKPNIIDDFSQYEGLKLNTGDRFVIYYMDNKTSGNYVTDILLPYISDKTTTRLFKMEIYALSKTGRKKIEVNPFNYTEADITTGFLNGSLDENVDYAVYNSDSEGTIEIRMTLEKPEYFNVKFKQYPSNDIFIKFNTVTNSNSFMQIKGFKYIFKYLTTPGTPLETGYMKYTENALYTAQGDHWIKKNKQTSSVILKNLELGTYSYQILPFTQYGYEYDLLKKGTFEVLESYQSNDQTVSINEFFWSYTDSQWRFQFDIDIDVDMTDTPPGTATNTLTSVHAELYDVWSNCSHVFDLTSTVPQETTSVVFDETFTFSTFEKVHTSVNTQTGNKYGIPYSELQNITLAKLPTLNGVNNGDKVEYISNTSVRQNHFYVFAIYYTYFNVDLNTSTEVGAYRYVYTNDAFVGYELSSTNFSFLDYIDQSISINTTQVSPTTTSTTYPFDVILDQSTLIFDPLLQEYNTPLKKTTYAIGPQDYFSDILNTNAWVKLTGISNCSFNMSQYNDYIIDSKAPGVVNTDIININSSYTGTTTNNGNATRSKTNVGTILSLPVFGTIQNQNYTLNTSKGLNQLQFNTFNSSFCSITTNKVYPYTLSEYDSSQKHFYPLYYQQSKEIQDKIRVSSGANLGQYTPSLTLNVSSIPVQPGLPLQGMYLSNGVTSELINSDEYSNTGINIPPERRFDHSVLWNNDGSDIHHSINYDNITLYSAFIAATKRRDLLTPTSQSIWTHIPEIHQYYYNTIIPILGGYNSDFGKIHGLETSGTTNAINALLFFGAYDTGTTDYYKYYTDKTKFSYEDNTSKVKFTVNTTINQSLDSDYCYKIRFGAKDKLIVLEEDNVNADDNIVNYINQRFNNFNIYSNTDFFPKNINTNLIPLTVNQFVEIFPTGDVMLTKTNSQIENTITDMTNHPSHGTSNYELLHFIDPTKGCFLQNSYKNSSYAGRLRTLFNDGGVTRHLISGETSLTLENPGINDLTIYDSTYLASNPNNAWVTYYVMTTYNIG